MHRTPQCGKRGKELSTLQLRAQAEHLLYYGLLYCSTVAATNLHRSHTVRALHELLAARAYT